MLKDIRGYVEDSGEGRWTVQAAIDENVPAPVITMSLLSRFVSRQDESFSAKVIAALRNQFGGHAVKHEPGSGQKSLAMATEVGIACRSRSGSESAAPPRARFEIASRTPAIVFFGASGDLVMRMLMPAMWNLRLGGILPIHTRYWPWESDTALMLPTRTRHRATTPHRYP